jgi:hypothetical protein
MTPIHEEHSRIAYCECGAQLQGESEGQLFDAAQVHLAITIPSSWGRWGSSWSHRWPRDVRGQSTPEAGGAHTAARQAMTTT